MLWYTAYMPGLFFKFNFQLLHLTLPAYFMLVAVVFFCIGSFNRVYCRAHSVLCVPAVFVVPMPVLAKTACTSVLVLYIIRATETVALSSSISWSLDFDWQAAEACLGHEFIFTLAC